MPPAPGVIQQFQQAMAQQDYARAVEIARRQVQLKPREPEGHEMCRMAFASLFRRDEALFHARAAERLAPNHPGVVESLADALEQAKKFEDALQTARRAERMSPDSAQVCGRIGRLLVALGRHIDAEEHCRAGLARFPNHPELSFRLNNALLEQGRAERSSEFIAQGMAHAPENARLAAYMCVTTNYVHPERREIVPEIHRTFGRLAMASAAGSVMRHLPPAPGGPGGLVAAGRGEGGRVRVGFISPDFCRHSVMYFLQPLLRGLDPARFEPVGIHTGFAIDEVTAQIASFISGEPIERARGATGNFRELRNWSHSPLLDPVVLAEHIRKQRVDVLVELVGHTAGSRWDALVMKPAPVIVTAIGYPATTGLPTVDYRLVDSITDPPGAEANSVERLIRLDPCFLCYEPAESVPECEMPQGPITFGSFNNLIKFNDGIARLWSRVLGAVPGSRLLMKAQSLGNERIAGTVMDRLVAAGIDASRVSLVGRIDDPNGHLGAYGRVHIALDVFPYAGTTTTCEAMCMGVPVVTLSPEGSLHAHRMGETLLRAAGCEQWVARTEDEYIRIAVGLASDTDRLRSLRASLRATMFASTLCDRAAYARRINEAIAGIWNTYAGRAMKGVSP